MQRRRFLTHSSAAIACANIVLRCCVALMSLHACGSESRVQVREATGDDDGNVGLLERALVLQRHEWDCGIAAVATLLRLEGLDVSYDSVARGVMANEHGVSMASLAGVAARLGRPLDGYRLRSLAALGIDDPWIALINSAYAGHYVVVSSRTAEAVVVLDPRAGVRRLSIRDFESAWSGYALLRKQRSVHGDSVRGR